jgi:hypothetical protein
MSLSLTQKFLTGLKRKYNLTIDDIIKQDYRYAGGTPDENNPSHYNYWKMLVNDKPYLKMPDYMGSCVCDHDIKNNCFIINKDDKLLVLGNCCIKKFIPNSGRTCGKCGEPHRNIKFNLCNECKQYACKICGKDKEKEYYKSCRKCYINKINNKEDDEKDEENIKINKIECKGDGLCFDSNTFSKLYECNFNCELKKCNDCNKILPEWVLNSYKGFCLGCDMTNFSYGKKIYLNIPYSDKEEAKEYKCKWDPDEKKWYFRDKNINKLYIINRWKVI